jgi:hypothetical protein
VEGKGSAEKLARFYKISQKRTNNYNLSNLLPTSIWVKVEMPGDENLSLPHAPCQDISLARGSIAMKPTDCGLKPSKLPLYV